MLFEFEIWSKRTMDTIDDDGELIQIQHPSDSAWYKRKFDIETDEVRITCFQEHEIFDNELKSKKCVQVFLSDEEYVYAAYSLDKWKALYSEHIKQIVENELVKKIVEDLKEEVVEKQNPDS